MHSHILGFRIKYSFRLTVMMWSAGTNQAIRDKTSWDQTPLQPLQGSRAFSLSHPFSSWTAPASTLLPFPGLAVCVATGWTGSRNWTQWNGEKDPNHTLSSIFVFFFPFLKIILLLISTSSFDSSMQEAVQEQEETLVMGSKACAIPTSPVPSQKPSPAWLEPWCKQVLKLQVLGSQRSRNYYYL